MGTYYHQFSVGENFETGIQQIKLVLHPNQQGYWNEGSGGLTLEVLTPCCSLIWQVKSSCWSMVTLADWWRLLGGFGFEGGLLIFKLKRRREETGWRNSGGKGTWEYLDEVSSELVSSLSAVFPLSKSGGANHPIQFFKTHLLWVRGFFGPSKVMPDSF